MIRAARRIDLDFCATRRAAPAAAWVLLALAAAFSADLGVSYYAVRQEVAAAETRLAGTHRAGVGAARGRTAAPDEIRQARETYLRLAMPWSELFSTLEGVATDKVRLLAIEPDPRAGTVVISGSANDYAAALDYVAALQGAKLLSRVHLVRHETRPDDPQRATAFSVSASWTEGQR